MWENSTIISFSIAEKRWKTWCVVMQLGVQQKLPELCPLLTLRQALIAHNAALLQAALTQLQSFYDHNISTAAERECWWSLQLSSQWKHQREKLLPWHNGQNNLLRFYNQTAKFDCNYNSQHSNSVTHYICFLITLRQRMLNAKNLHENKFALLNFTINQWRI